MYDNGKAEFAQRDPRSGGHAGGDGFADRLTLRRTLPIDYLETANCLRLAAEDAQGRPAELVFYSNTGLGRLRDLTGGGPDKDPCGGHSSGE